MINAHYSALAPRRPRRPAGQVAGCSLLPTQPGAASACIPQKTRNASTSHRPSCPCPTPPPPRESTVVLFSDSRTAMTCSLKNRAQPALSVGVPGRRSPLRRARAKQFPSLQRTSSGRWPSRRTVIMNVVDDEGAVPGPCFFRWRYRRHDVVVTLATSLFVSSFFHQYASADERRDDGAAVRTVETHAATPSLNAGTADPPRPCACVWPQARSADDLTSSMVIRRDGILVPQQGGRQRRRAERDGVTIISRRRRRRRRDRRQRRRGGDRWRRRRRRAAGLPAMSSKFHLG